MTFKSKLKLANILHSPVAIFSMKRKVVNILKYRQALNVSSEILFIRKPVLVVFYSAMTFDSSLIRGLIFMTVFE